MSAYVFIPMLSTWRLTADGNILTILTNELSNVGIAGHANSNDYISSTLFIVSAHINISGGVQWSLTVS